MIKKQATSVDKDFKKATRSVTITLENKTNNSLFLNKENTLLKNGKWSIEPISTLAPDESVSWACYTKDYRGTVEGVVGYHFAGDEEDPVLIRFNCAKEKAKSTCEGTTPGGFEFERSGELDKHFNLTFTLKEASHDHQQKQADSGEGDGINSSFQHGSTMEDENEPERGFDSIEMTEEQKDDFWGDEEEPTQPKFKVVIRSAKEISNQPTNEELAAITKTVVSSPFGPGRTSATPLASEAIPSSRRAGNRRRGPVQPSPFSASGVSSSDPQSSIMSSMKSCVSSLESGQFSTSLQHAKTALQTIQGIKNLEERQKEFRIVLVYNIALELFQKIQGLETADKNEVSVEQLKLYLFLSFIPLHPKHSIVNFRRAINEAVKLNYLSSIQPHLEKLAQLDLPDKENIQSLLEQSHQSNSTRLPTTFCYQTFQGLANDKEHQRCSFCEATFSNEISLEKCPFCQLAKIASTSASSTTV